MDFTPMKLSRLRPTAIELVSITLATLALISIWFFSEAPAPRILANTDPDSATPEIDRLYAAADAVMRVRLDAADTQFAGYGPCGTRYAATIKHVLKPDYDHYHATEGQALSFGRHAGLDPGRDYILFLRWVGDAEGELERLAYEGGLHAPRDDGTKGRALATIRCNGLVPGYAVLGNFPLLAWRIDNAGVHVFGMSRANIPASIDVLAIDRGTLVLRAKDVERHFDELSRSRRGRVLGWNRNGFSQNET